MFNSYIMQWNFDKEGENTLTKDSALPTMVLTSGMDTSLVKMQQVDFSEARITLGIWISPDLQMKNYAA